LWDDKDFKRFIRGKKEQSMRNWLFLQETADKVKVDSSEVARYYEFAGREYSVSYYSVTDTMLLRDLDNGKDQFEKLFREIYGNSAIPIKKISWAEHESFDVLNLFYSQKIQNSAIVPPLKISESEYILYKIHDWADTKIYTEKQTRERWDKVERRLKNKKKKELWEDYISKIMDEKTVKFDNSVFQKVSDVFFKFYKHDAGKHKIDRRQWEWFEQSKKYTQISEALGPAIHKSFFEIDGITWKVNKFLEEYFSHPLAFRDYNTSPKDFSEQFRKVVYEIIRDEYLTEESYKRGYDSVKNVISDETTWRDICLAVYQRDNYLKRISAQNRFNNKSILENNLNAICDSLFSIYGKNIYLNLSSFEQISLGSTYLETVQNTMKNDYNEPFFPIFTSNQSIGYLTIIND